ncbi:MAG: mannose-1-phosphate guanylyltransferase [Bacteroidales bacterium]|nr:mannose-1-phosphate guanylyltransferase [Bacteroidales bacterium]
MNSNYYCVIMAGGVGARFWPVSRRHTPKQFIDILDDGESLIQKTFRRFADICPQENIYIITNSQYASQVREQIPGLADEQLVLEPARRNTAPCIAYANYKIKAKNPDAVIVVAPSDHVILKEDVFKEVIINGLNFVEKNPKLLTIGIRPSSPNTGYGYIQYNEDATYADAPSIYNVKIFTEKPELEVARQFVESGEFLWNAGIFMWSLKEIEKAFETCLPEVNDLFRQGEGLYNTPEEENFIKATYLVCKNISIDYGVMEHARNVCVCAADFGWSDLGTWGSLYEISPKDEHQNVVAGNKVKTYNSQGCIINVPKNKAVVLQGMDDYIVVDNDNVLLICKKENEQQIRQYVNDVQIDFGDKYI